MRWAVPLTLAAPFLDATVTHGAGMLAPMPTPTQRVVRRRAGAAHLLVAGLVVWAASGCGGVGQPAPYESLGIDGLTIPTPTPDPDDFEASIDNPWLPLTPGSTWRYDVSDDSTTIGSIETEVLADTTEIAGLVATQVRTTTVIDGVEETSTRFYAQDEAGNVWWVGEDSRAITWRAGERGAEAGLAMPRFPRLGDGWRSYAVDGLPQASARVEHQGREMVQTSVRHGKSAAADATTRDFYQSGVGLVGVEELGSGRQIDLVDHRAG